MKMLPLLLASGLLAACSPSPEGTNMAAPATQPAPTSTAATPADAGTGTTASASGVVESVDADARTITIAHGPVEALKWPAMTMAFQAPGADLGSIKQGDHVTFEFTSAGMKATITKIAKQ
jgi:Cu(I)/Ag(I) efflux system protein CusF